MKKVIAIVAALVLVIGCFAACNDNKDNKEETTAGASEKVTVEVEDEEETEDEVEVSTDAE